MLTFEVDTNQLLIVASLFIVILLALMVARHFEKRHDREMVDKIYDDIQVD